ncbi:AMP-binding protein [Pectobacterium brasiliense]|uniref:AMP-binding protein n=1 Tax=Pectobacterium brasiliense TaxID=180957 RepID=A0AAW9HFR5_9GAMM|nr:AMP-binding protein [Pectobacterium brasiliense]MDY4379456.1 AMP-binding protein [Pectobacterium brasiliense]
MDNTLLRTIKDGCKGSFDKVAITYANHHFKYSDLIDINRKITLALEDLNVPQNSFIACAFPRGGLGAILCLSVNAHWAAMPLPTGLQSNSIMEILDLVRVSAFLIEESQTQMLEIAERLRFPIILVNNTGRVLWQQIGKLKIAPRNFDKIKNYALLIPTSGSTGYPKYVPLSDENILSASRGIINWFGLTPDDKCLNMMPSYHVHGLISATYSTLLSNGTVINSDGMRPDETIKGVNKNKPTWWTGVPALYESIISAHESGSEVDKNAINSIRFIRVSSAPLTQSLTKRLRKNKFFSPIIHSYGLTETASLICSLPLHAPDEKNISVGFPVNSDIKIIDKNNEIVPYGRKGEVIIKGDSVMDGYLDIDTSDIQNPFLEQSRWFRTGDEGYFDMDGFLYITGRFKTIIRRGAHSVSPAEIERAVTALDYVVDCLVFSVPHSILGEDIVCLYTANKKYDFSKGVLNDNSLRLYLFDKLEGYKVPSVILCVEEIKKNSVGKLDRINTQEEFISSREFKNIKEGSESAITETERFLVEKIWRYALKTDKEIKRDANLLLYGADPIIINSAFDRLKLILCHEFERGLFFKYPSICEQGVIIDTVKRIIGGENVSVET